MFCNTNSFDFTLGALPLPPLPHHVMTSASQTPLRPQPFVAVTVGGDSNKKRALTGSPPLFTDTPMSDAEANGHQPEPEPAHLPTRPPTTLLMWSLTYQPSSQTCWAAMLAPQSLLSPPPPSF